MRGFFFGMHRCTWFRFVANGAEHCISELVVKWGFVSYFITFEGIEGSGKSTQMKLLVDRLVREKWDVVETREPGGTDIGDQIRQILLDAKNSSMVRACEVLLYYAARAQHLEQLIRPSLKSNKVVLCDRFVDATIAYQGYARGVNFDVLESLNAYVLQDLQPDLTLVFDMTVEMGLGRAKFRAMNLNEAQREDRFENEMMEFHQKVREGYLQIAAKHPKRVVVLDATLSIDDLHEMVFKSVNSRLQKK